MKERPREKRLAKAYRITKIKTAVVAEKHFASTKRDDMKRRKTAAIIGGSRLTRESTEALGRKNTYAVMPMRDLKGVR